MRSSGRKARDQASVSEPPAIVLSGIRGSVDTQAFYHPKDNKILLTYGAYIIPFDQERPDHAAHLIEVLRHELAHWATFIYLTPKQRCDVMKEYEQRFIGCEAGGADPFFERRSTLLERIANHVSDLKGY
jgi:hypothetical protein